MIQADEPSDEALAIRAARGEEAAFGVLMRRHKGWLYRFVRRYVGDAEEGYDVLQESFASAWSGLSRYDPERPFTVWLRRIALNKCRDRARRAAVRRVLFGSMGANAKAPDVADPSPTADEAAATSRAVGRLEVAIAALPRQLKEPLVLTALEGMSHKEAAEMLGLNAKAVETRVYRAKKQLALLLEREDLADIAGARR